MSDLAKHLLYLAKVELRKGNFHEAEDLIKRARKHDKSGLTPMNQMAALQLEVMSEDRTAIKRIFDGMTRPRP